MKPKHSLLAALCALSFAGAAQAALPAVDCAGVAHWSNVTGYPQGESFVHLGSLYQTSVDVVRGEEPFRSGSENHFELLGRCAGLSIPASILNPLDGSVLYQGVKPANAWAWVNPLWGEPITRVGVYFNGQIIGESRSPIDLYVYVQGFFAEPNRLGAARLEFRVEYADGSGHTEAAKLEVLPAAAIDRVAPAAPNVVLQSVGADRVGIRWNAVQDAPGGSGGVRYRVTLARQTYILNEGVTSIELADLRRNTRHIINVEAIDRAGNASPKGFIIATTTH